MPVFERILYLVRKRIEKRISDPDFYICSLSNSNIVYKVFCLLWLLPLSAQPAVRQSILSGKEKQILKQILTILKTNLKRKSLLLLNVLIRPFRKRKVRRMLHRIRNLQLAIKVPKQLIQKLKAKPQSPKKKTLKKKAVRIVKFLHRKKAK